MYSLTKIMPSPYSWIRKITKIPNKVKLLWLKIFRREYIEDVDKEMDLWLVVHPAKRYFSFIFFLRFFLVEIFICLNNNLHICTPESNAFFIRGEPNKQLKLVSQRRTRIYKLWKTFSDSPGSFVVNILCQILFCPFSKYKWIRWSPMIWCNYKYIVIMSSLTHVFLGDHPVQEALRGQRSLLQAVPKYKTTAVHQVRQMSSKWIKNVKRLISA